MNLTCPNCGARFKIKDDALGTKGRKVKCGKCEHRWYAMPEEAAAAPTAPAPADPTEDFAPPPPPPPPPMEEEVLSMTILVRMRQTSAVCRTKSSRSADSGIEFRTTNQAPEPKRGGMLKYWVLLLILLIGGLSAAFVWRDTVVHHFPVANKVFMMADSGEHSWIRIEDL